MKVYNEYKYKSIDWFQNTPKSWDLVKPKFRLKKVDRVPDQNDEIITCFRDGVVTLRNNRRTDGFTNSIKEHGYQQVLPGDLVVHEMDAFEGAIGISDSKGKSTPVYTVIEKDNLNDLRYIAYLLKEMSRSGKIESLSRSIRERTTDFRWKTWSNLYFPFPPLEDQIKISDNLDLKIKKINFTKEKIFKKIELLKEHRKCLISNLVNKGFSKINNYKDSNIAWIGKIPENYKLIKGKFLFKFQKQINIKLENKNLLSLTLKGVINKDFYSNEGLRPENYETYQIFEKDDLVFKMIDLENVSTSRVGIVHEKGIMSSAYIRLIPTIKEIFPKYAYWCYFDLYNKQIFNALGSGVRSTLTSDDLLNIKLPVPSIEEQKKISNYLDFQKSRIDKNLDNFLKKIEYLSELSKTLISGYVTGKIRC
jgi:type I restriction enzyme S subunit